MRMRMFLRLALAASLLGGLSAADQWPQFRGPAAGRVADDPALPDRWSETENGRGVWANYGTNLVWHLEGGENARGALVKFQLRPDALARRLTTDD